MKILSQSLTRIRDESQQLKKYFDNKYVVHRWRQEAIRGTAGRASRYLVPHDVVNALTDITLYELRFEGPNYPDMRSLFDEMCERLSS